MSFEKIPPEMRAYNQWVCWRLEFRPPMVKPTKVPYMPWANGGKASVTDERHWGTYDQAIKAPLNCHDAVDPDIPVSRTGYSGIGFVLTKSDPYTFIDCDDTKGNTEDYQRQLKLFQDCNSYSELSPSKAGCHIIVKGELPGPGRRRASIEIYDTDRYMTMTGDVINNVGIRNCQEVLNVIYPQLGGPAAIYTVVEDSEQKITDEAVIETATNAANGELFMRLYSGDWQSLYGSQSEADFALINIIGFYSRNRVQIKRIFRTTALGQRDKAKRDDYLDKMIDRSFDNQLPPIDLEGLLVNNLAFGLTDGAGASITGQGSQAPAPNSVGEISNAAATISHDFAPPVNPFPPGLIGQVAQFIYDAAPRPVREIALAGAIAMLAGIAGRAYNISGTGLNQYILLLAQTGVGKDAMSDGTTKLLTACRASVPAIMDFKGPGELVSSAGIIRWFAEKSPCFFSTIGEFGKKMREMSSHTANAHLQGISRTLLQLYSKSGHNSVFDPMAYSESAKNTKPLIAPALTILGESVPENFYEVMDESLIADGLLPRFMVFEYRGKREFLNHGHNNLQPPLVLLQALSDLAAYCLGIMNRHAVHNVVMNAEATAKFNEFDQWTTNEINNAKTETHRMLWNRAHIKATKLAALYAVGINYLDPVVDIHACLWATNIIVQQTTKLVAKFESGAVGAIGGNEGRQVNEIIKVIALYLTSPYSKYSKYGGTEEMHKLQVVTEAHVSRRVQSLACFKHDRIGATNAIKRSLKILLDADELREMPAIQMIEKFGSKPRAFVVSNPARFVVKDDD